MAARVYSAARRVTRSQVPKKTGKTSVRGRGPKKRMAQKRVAKRVAADVPKIKGLTDAQHMLKLFGSGRKKHAFYIGPKDVKSGVKAVPRTKVLFVPIESLEERRQALDRMIDQKVGLDTRLKAFDGGKTLKTFLKGIYDTAWRNLRDLHGSIPQNEYNFRLKAINQARARLRKVKF